MSVSGSGTILTGYIVTVPTTALSGTINSVSPDGDYGAAIDYRWHVYEVQCGGTVEGDTSGTGAGNSANHPSADHWCA